jgi:hypothetical protein
MKIFTYLAITPLFIGCLATTDLTQEPKLPESERILLSTIADNIGKACVKVQYDASGNKTGNSTALNRRVSIKRYYVSDTDWIKLEANSAGVWDNVYFNRITNRIVCGQKDWDSYSDTKLFSFYEYGTERKTINASPSTSQSISISNSQTHLTAVAKFRATGLSQIKYSTDADLCADLKFGFEFAASNNSLGQSLEDINTALRLTKIGEVFDELGKYKEQEAVFDECRKKYF